MNQLTFAMARTSLAHSITCFPPFPLSPPSPRFPAYVSPTLPCPPFPRLLSSLLPVVSSSSPRLFLLPSLPSPLSPRSLLSRLLVATPTGRVREQQVSGSWRLHLSRRLFLHRPFLKQPNAWVRHLHRYTSEPLELKLPLAHAKRGREGMEEDWKGGGKVWGGAEEGQHGTKGGSGTE